MICPSSPKPPFLFWQQGGKGETKRDMSQLTETELLTIAKPELRLYDSETGESVMACKIVDATHLCADSKRCVIKYAHAKRGVIFQICDWYEADKDLGTTVHYFLNEMSIEECVVELAVRSAILGVNSIELTTFIYTNRP